MDNIKKGKIFYLGISGFPYGMATMERLKLISRALVPNFDVYVMNKTGEFSSEDNLVFESSGRIDGINYFYTSGNIYRSRNIFKRNILKIYGFINEVIIIRRIKREEKAAAILIASDFFLLIYYWLISRLAGFKIIYDYVELRTGTLQGNKSLYRSINHKLLDKYFHHFIDAVIPISGYLTKQFIQKSDKPYLKIPVIVDVNRFRNIEKSRNENYFLFCGSIGYFDVIEFCIRSFNEIKENNNYYLYLVVNKPNDAKLQGLIEELNLQSRIKLFTAVPDDKLASLYVNAKGLLIPLRPNLQDKARFPHKIGEYCASGTPFITTATGEIKSYFTDGVNAVIASEFDITRYSKKMQFIIDNPEEASKIGGNSQKTAFDFFHYEKHALPLYNFISQLTY